MQKIVKECGKEKDHVDIFVGNTGNNNVSVCCCCSFIYPKTKPACPQCGNNPSFTTRDRLYSEVPSKHHILVPNIAMGEVIGVNPNSKETIKQVLINVKQQCNIATDRYLIRFGAD